MKRCCLFLIAGMVLLGGCASVSTEDIKVKTQSDPKTNFKGLKTYAWLGSAAIVNDPLGQWEPPTFDADAEIRTLINRQLQGRGMVETSGRVDLIVAYAAGINMDAFRLKVNPETKMNMLEQVPEGGLVVVFMDGISGQVNWVAVASADIQKNPTAKTVKKRLDYAVTQMFKALPK